MKMLRFEPWALSKNFPKRCAEEIEAAIWNMGFNAEPDASYAYVICSLRGLQQYYVHAEVSMRLLKAAKLSNNPLA